MSDFDPLSETARNMSDDDLWDVAWKESWLALANDSPGGEVNDDQAFNKARELWAGWMMQRKQLEPDREEAGLPMLPVSPSPAGSPTRGLDSTPPASPMRANAPEYIPNTATPLLPGQKKDRTFFQDWLATQSPNLLDPDFCSTGVPGFPMNMASMGFMGAAGAWPPTAGRAPDAPADPRAVAPAPQILPGGKPGLLGDGASYFLLEPQPAETEAGSKAPAHAPEPEAVKPVAREDVTQGWLPAQFAWVDPIEDDTCPPPPILFELALPPSRVFSRSPGSKPTRLMRVDGFSAAMNPDQLKALLASYGPGINELFVVGHAKKQMGMRIIVGYDNENRANTLKKALHMKTHEYGLEPLTCTFGVMKEKKDPQSRSQAARDRKSRKGREPTTAVPSRQVGSNSAGAPQDTSWKAMWSQMPGASAVPGYPGDFPFPSFPYPTGFGLDQHGNPQPATE